MVELEQLARLPFFQGFSSGDLAVVLAGGEPRMFKEGQVVFGEKLPDDCSIFVAVEGGIRVSIAGKDHQQFVIGNAGEGTIFGEMSFVDGQPRSATITATRTLSTVSISRSAFDVLCAANPAVALKLMRRLAHIISMRLRNADKFVVEAKSMVAQGAQGSLPTREPPKPAPQLGGKAKFASGKIIDEAHMPSVFAPVEKLPDASIREAGGLMASDIKGSPDVFRKGDPQKRVDTGE